ncbi:Membrane protein involved in the export of O-antigen and teichoic acid [Lishizhenia tianjinensis]|uniref:Membrane protein involved in the export of O-antigen and teichoic acid n=1 Tax=Lishizhenia tianjinensis TaxID=477690 RepID=A0A1I6YIZ0_9FLAO|nr:polysaccharide biosynthesis C-terminal domain-containing protein [Lishizhenia tianjinensis]SFT50410.1 Membrane protein involved in the export of O-antigen and teichoic acid [Lishizhenia tianjinensis]
MGIVLKHTLKGSIYLYLGTLIGGINVSLLFPNLLGEQQWGVLTILLTLVAMGSQFSQLGLPSVITKYFPLYNNSEVEGFLRFIALSFILSTGIITLLVIIFQSQLMHSYRIDDVSPFFFVFFVCGLIFFTTMLRIITSLLVIQYKTPASFFFVEVLLRVLQSLFLVIYHFTDLNFTGFLGLYLASYILVNLVALIYFQVSKTMKLNLFLERTSGLKIREYIHYGLYTFFNGFGNEMIKNLDLLMLGYLVFNGDILAGKYKSITFFASLILIPLRPLHQILITIVSNNWTDTKNNEIEGIYRDSSFFGIFVSGLIYFLLLFNFNWISELFPIIDEGLLVLTFFGLGTFINAVTGINASLISFSKFFKFNTFSLLISLVVNIVLNYLLIKEFNIIGAAISTGFSTLFLNLIRYYFLKRKFGYSPFTRLNLFQLITIIGLCVLAVFLNHFKLINTQSSIIGSVIISGFFFYYIYNSQSFKKALSK